MQQEQTASDLTQKLWNGQLTLEEISNSLGSGDLDRKDAEHLRKALISDRTSDLKAENELQKDAIKQKQAETYMAMWDMILKKGTAADKRRRLLQEYSDGNLDKNDAVKLYTGYIIPNEGGGKVSLAEAVAAEQAGSQKFKFIRAAINWFNRTFNQGESGDEGDTE